MRAVGSLIAAIRLIVAVVDPLLTYFRVVKLALSSLKYSSIFSLSNLIQPPKVPVVRSCLHVTFPKAAGGELQGEQVQLLRLR